MSQEVKGTPSATSDSKQLYNKKSKVNDSRDFKCPCGKGYMSYPALFTHVKQKHDGQAPGEVIRPQNTNIVRRGRPRIRPHIALNNNDEQSQSIDDLCEYINSLTKSTETFDLKPFYKSSLLYQSLKQRIEDSKLSSYVRRPASEATCLSALVQFLFSFSQNPAANIFLPKMLTLLVFLLEFINSNKKTPSFCQTHSSSNLILEVNNFFLSLNQTYLPRLSQAARRCEFFNSYNIARIIEYLFVWLFRHKYSSSWVQINQIFVQNLKQM